jgi:hypothetical protein
MLLFIKARFYVLHYFTCNGPIIATRPSAAASFSPQKDYFPLMLTISFRNPQLLHSLGVYFRLLFVPPWGKLRDLL